MQTDLHIGSNTVIWHGFSTSRINQSKCWAWSCKTVQGEDVGGEKKTPDASFGGTTSVCASDPTAAFYRRIIWLVGSPSQRDPRPCREPKLDWNSSFPSALTDTDDDEAHSVRTAAACQLRATAFVYRFARHHFFFFFWCVSLREVGLVLSGAMSREMRPLISSKAGW